MSVTSLPEQRRGDTDKARRMVRGLDLYVEHGDEIVRLDEGRYRVPSQTSYASGKVYRVRTDEGAERCSCPAFQMDPDRLRQPCKHVYAAIAWEEEHLVELRVEEGRWHDHLQGREYQISQYRQGRFVRTIAVYTSMAEAYEDKWAVESEGVVA